MQKIFVLSREESRKIDQIAMEKYKVPGVVLMENAGRGITEVLMKHRQAGQVLIFCGTGNNAGDGMVIARHLLLQGVPGHVFLCTPPEKFRGDALVQYEILKAMNYPMTPLFDVPPEKIERTMMKHLDDPSWLVDAMLGTGATGAPRAPMDAVIRWMNSVQNPVLAVDLPSGLDADTGEPAEICVQADVTCTLAVAKPGLLKEKAKKYVGELVVCSIGFPVELILAQK